MDVITMMMLQTANDNDPMWDAHDPRDWDAFDPAELPADMFYDDDMPLDVCSFMSRYA